MLLELTVQVPECLDQQVETDVVITEKLMCKTEPPIDVNK